MVDIHPVLPAYSKKVVVKCVDWYNIVCAFKVYL